jgi:hypothetical protein
MPPTFTELQSRRLDRAAENLAPGQTALDLECRLAGLRPQAERFFRLLHGGEEFPTTEVRRKCSIGNVSDVAKQFNRAMRDARQSYRMVCTIRPHENQFGEENVIGYWSLREETPDAGI